ncbi:type IV pilus modification protein PilV [Algiphilus aromaticivorans]|uniref:type IV pilus modification protein PilV n=1 Tax=Algiphilus aromaticivorans TaxID=382454 RepID=UPI0005C1FEDF|nr:type IV pilus modification protein PilV [Algiphilus aromaticivorans]
MLKNAYQCGPTARQRGVTMIEVLIAILVLSFGLLGIAGMQWNSLQFNHSALLRSQASNLAYDMSDRLRANRAAARSGDFAAPDFSDPNCQGFNPSDASPANEVLGWRCQIANLLPEGQGRVLNNGDRYTVELRWRDQREADDDDAFVVFSTTTEL